MSFQKQMGFQGYLTRRSSRPQDTSLGQPTWKLLTHEIHLKEDEEEAQNKEGVAFRTTNEELHSSKDESSESDEDSMVIIVRRLKKTFKSKIFDPKKFYKKASLSKRHEKNSKGTKTFNNKNKSNLIPCFDCGFPGHVVKHFLSYKTKLKNGSKRPRKNSREQ